MGKNEFGDLNPRSINTRHRQVSSETSGIKYIRDSFVKSNDTIKDALKSKGPYMAEVLKVFDSPSDMSTLKSAAGGNLWSSVESKPDDVVTIIARVPELHHFCMPENLPLDPNADTYAHDAKVVDMYPRFVAAHPGIVMPEVGQKIWVEFEDEINYYGGVYLGVVDSNEVVSPTARKKADSPKKAHKKPPKPPEVKASTPTAPKKKAAGAPPKATPKATPTTPIMPGEPIPGGGYHKTVTAWENALQSTGQIGQTWIGPIDGNGTPDPKHENGHRDNIIFVPDKFNKSKPLEVILWFHGHLGFHERTFEVRILRHIDDLYSDGRNVIIIIPECSWSSLTSTPKDNSGRGLPTKRHQFSNYFNVVVEILKNNMAVFAQKPGTTTTAIGHSAGGNAISKIAKAPQNEEGEDFLSGLWGAGANRIIYSDSSYGNWVKETYKWYVKNADGVELIILTIPPPRPRHIPHLKAKSFTKRQKPERTTWISLPYPWFHETSGDNVIRYPKGYIATGVASPGAITTKTRSKKTGKLKPGKVEYPKP